MKTFDVDESKDLTKEDSRLLLRWKEQPPERLRRIVLLGRLQRHLFSRGHTFPLSVDGQYGPNTDTAATAETESAGLNLGPELSAIVKAHRQRTSGTSTVNFAGEGGNGGGGAGLMGGGGGGINGGFGIDGVGTAGDREGATRSLPSNPVVYAAAYAGALAGIASGRYDEAAAVADAFAQALDSAWDSTATPAKPVVHDIQGQATATFKNKYLRGLKSLGMPTTWTTIASDIVQGVRARNP